MLKRIFHNRTGFTTAELLVTVAIVTIVSVVSIPAVASLRQDLQMERLDSFARELYVAAQNRAVSMKATGELTEYAAAVKALPGRNLTTAPSGYPEGDESWQHLYYVSSSDDATTRYLASAQAVTMAQLPDNAWYILELNPDSGDIYSVFYGEGTPASYQNDLLTLLDRSRFIRRSLPVGYYGGESALVAEVPTAFTPNLTVINKEELYLELTCGGLTRLAPYQQHLTIEIQLTDEHEHSVSRTWTGLGGGGDEVMVTDSLSLSWVLDGMGGGQGFEQKFPSLTPGDDLLIEATITYDYRGVRITGTAIATVNSLFAEVSADSSEIKVSYVRHLNNLRQSIYAPDAVANNLTVTQGRHIDFNAANWEADAVSGLNGNGNPLSSFAPITSDELFQRGGGWRATFDGQGNSISNFKINGSGAAGLISAANGVTFQNIRLVDTAVNGGNNTGSLAGSLSNGVVSNCGAYLTSRTAEGGWRTDMPAWVNSHRVSGGSNVGGLIGSVSNCQISNSFAAIDVSGGSGVGGLIGSGSGSVSNSYASGDVTATSNGGGLAGSFSGTVSDCYSTSDIKGSSSGGLFGTVSGSVRDCSSYGEVEARSSNNSFAASRSGASFSDCRYLWQLNYNDSNAFAAIDGVTRRGYNELLSSTPLTADNSYPYLRGLRNKSFPFDSQITPAAHYGDWPEESKIKHSLVYYEKYPDGGYGFYALTALEGGDTLTLDTLRNGAGTYCVEDGYALMSISPLSSFTYSLNSGANVNVPVVSQAGSATSSNSLLIDAVENLDFTDASGSTVTASYVYIYRLPFALQNTSRTASNPFYDQLKIVQAVDQENQIAFSNYTFYFCPHFAKNAINTGDQPVTLARPIGDIAYVRSARQLNALGRFNYYWGGQNNTTFTQVTYTQELDLHFSQYTKNYCGVQFNLMDTTESNAYRNRPIGGQTPPDGSVQWPGSFQFNYDGQGYKIINYCLESYDGFRFTGMFGQLEVARKDGNLVPIEIRNVVLCAADGITPYIVSNRNNGMGADSAAPAVGALVGLVYADNAAASAVTTVTNCFVSGYRVAYEAPNGTDSGHDHYYTVGGLVGNNMGVISNCAATNTRVEIAAQDGRAGAQFTLGGLVGSNAANISNSYAACTFAVSNDASKTAHIGGLVGAYTKIYGYEATNKIVSNCYSYSSLKDTTVSNNITARYYGALPTATYAESNCYYLAGAETIGALSLSDSNGALTWAQLDQLTLGAAFGTAARTYPYAAALAGQAYPFPAVVRDGGNNLVHYGDWPAPDAAPASVGDIGLARVERARRSTYPYYSYTRTFSQYDTATGDSSTTGGPEITFNTNGTRFYLYTKDLDPSLVVPGTNPAGWELTSVTDGGGQSYDILDNMSDKEYAVRIQKWPNATGYIVYQLTFIGEDRDSPDSGTVFTFTFTNKAVNPTTTATLTLTYED